MKIKRLKRNKDENFLKVIFIQIVLLILGYLAGTTIYNLIKGLLNFSSYGIFNLFFDFIIIFIAVAFGWWLWDYNGILKKNK
jgi:hypothetical protein